MQIKADKKEKTDPLQQADVRSMNLSELEAFMCSIGEEPFRAKQMYEWMHIKCVSSIDDMTNLSKTLREKLKETCIWTSLETVTVQRSRLDGTCKYLFELSDGNQIESVLMHYHHGSSVCISSQAGCAMGCRFCASTIGGKTRDLTAGEMLDQIYRIQADTGERVSNVVVMGTGEPLDNYENLLRFLTMLTDEHGLHISQRNVTVSTCGIVPKIRALADQKLAITLAVSLHAATQEKRQMLMPVARKYDLSALMDACDYYFRKTGRRITFEYSLIAEDNDTDADAAALGRLLSGRNCHVNLIPVNPVRERSFHSPQRRAVEAFKNKLEKYGINVTIRREMGRDIDGACGQLRMRYADK